MTSSSLTGRKQICSHLRRGWPVVHNWIRKRGLPARKIDGVWESDTELLDIWKKEIIRKEKTSR